MEDELENIFGIQDAYIELGNSVKAAEAILAFSITMSVRGPALLRVPKLMASLNSFNEEENKYVGKLALELSKAHLDKGEWNEGELFADKAVRIAKKNANKSDLANALMQQGKMMKERGYLHRSIFILEQAEKLYTGLGNYTNSAVCLTFIAAVQERLGNFSDSLKSFGKAEKICDENLDILQKGMIYNRRGLAYWHHGNVQKALESIKISQEISEKAGNKMWIPAHITNTGLYLADLDRFDEAINCFKNADSLHKERGTIHWAAVNYGGWGRALLMRNKDNDLDEAIKLLQKAEKFSRTIYYPENIALHIGDLGRAYFIKEEWEKAYNNVSEAVALERRMGANNEHRHFCNLVILSSICQKIKKKDQYWESLVRALHLQKKLGLNENHQIRKVREDCKRLEKLIKYWNVDHSLFEKIEYDGIFKDTIVKPPSIISNLNVSSLRAYELLDEIQKMLDDTGYEYPWYSLEQDLKAQGKNKIIVFGYGSLLNKISAKQTLNQDSVEKYRPVIGFGIRRLLDYNMPDKVKKRSMYKNVSNPNSIGLFNARFTGSITDSANGALIEISLDDISSLREREIGYDLRPVICIPWQNPNGEIIKAYTLGCSGRLWEGKMLSVNTLMPHEDYYRLCREGAAKISDEFLEYFLETAYLADGKTKVKEWEKLIKLD